VVLVGALAATIVAAPIFAVIAQEQSNQGGCLSNMLGDMVCFPPGGAILKDMRGDLVCGLGQCMKDFTGEIVCLSQPGGYVTKKLGSVACTGGCEYAVPRLTGEGETIFFVGDARKGSRVTKAYGAAAAFPLRG
jgi:hypothetical protein